MGPLVYQSREVGDWTVDTTQTKNTFIYKGKWAKINSDFVKLSAPLPPMYGH